MTDLSALGLSSFQGESAPSEQTQKSALGRDEFLKLLVTQLENQDPLSPQENGEFIAQLAQFSSLEEAQNLNEGFNNFAGSFQSSQHLQATSLVGRPVHDTNNQTFLGTDDAVSILAEIPAGTESASLSVYNSNGSLVDNFDLGETTPGRNEFIWTGEDQGGERYPSGVYRFEVNTGNKGIVEAAPIYLSSNVNSVTIEPGGSLTLNLAGIGPTAMSEVIQIN